MDSDKLQAIRSRTIACDGADFLTTQAERDAYLEAALADGDPQVIATARENIARAQAAPGASPRTPGIPL
jgi:DNA-binding phage protein